MPITQILLTASTAGGGGGGGGSVNPDGTFLINGVTIPWGSAGIAPTKPTYNSSYLLPDGNSNIQMWEFNGSNHLMTTPINTGFTDLYMNIWFYPTAQGRTLMTVQNTLGEQISYHHTGLEINSNGTVTGTFYSNAYITTANAVNLNQWNHIYFRNNGTQTLLQLNGGTAVTANQIWARPTNLVLGFGTVSITGSGSNYSRYQGWLGEFEMSPVNMASNYDATRVKYEEPQVFIYDDFTVEWWQKAENPSANVQPFTIGVLPSTMELSIRYGGPASGHSGQDRLGINNGFALASQPVKNHYTGSWEHMAIVRKDGDVKVYSNGTAYLTLTKDNSSANTVFDNLTADLVIGTGGQAPPGVFNNYQGYIKDFHVIKGYAKYTANFLAPTSPIQPQTGTVFLLSAMSSGTAFDDVVSYKAAILTNTPTYSEDDPWTYPGATFTALGYGNNLITPTPYPPNLQVGLLVSDGAGWSDYIIDPNYFGNIQLSSLPESTPPELVYTVSEDLTSVTQNTNTAGGSGPTTWVLDYSGIYFNVELLKVRQGWTVVQGENILGTVRANAYLITPEVIRIGVNFDPYSGSGLEFTYLPPAYGGSIYFDSGDYINYGISVDWAFDVDGISTGSITLNIDANDIASYSGTGFTWTDLSGNANNGTLINSPYWDSGPPGYFNFNGVNQYATVAGANIIPQSAYTKMVWFKINTFSADNNLVSSDNGGHFMYFNQTNTLYAGHSNVLPYNSFGSVATFNTDTWYCAVVTFSVANGIKLYVNGVLDTENLSYQTPHNQNGNTNIACFGIGGNLLNGKIGRVLCYGRELTAGQVLQNFNATRNRYGI